MRLTTRQSGIISYAGLDEHALWEGARRIFALSETAPPERFASFLPLFPSELIVHMRYLGRGRFSCAASEYHQKLHAEMPGLYTGANALRCLDREDHFRKNAAVTVDAAWAEQFPQYRPFLGERLHIHLIGGGHQAVAVPESIFPRGGGVLAGAERELGVTARCRHYTQWLCARLDAGAAYDPARLEESYLAETGLASVCIQQAQLTRAIAETAVMRGLQDEPSAAEALPPVRQYVPFRYAADVFEEMPVSRQTTRLMQLYFSGERFLGDLWLPWEAASQYIHKRRGVLDVRALCEGFQIAPALDPDTRGGCYPDRVRLVSVRDRNLRMLVADARSNTAYGSGLSPQGGPNRLVFLMDSQQLIRDKRLSEEPCPVTCINTRVEEADYLRMLQLAQWQEYRGRLIDAMRQRERALAQLTPGTPAYDHALEMADEKVRRLEERLKGAPEHSGGSYDEDLAYLRRMARCRVEQLPFDRDEARERSLETGAAMRLTMHTHGMSDLLGRPVPIERPRAKSVREQPSGGLVYEQMNMFAACSADSETKEDLSHEHHAP